MPSWEQNGSMSAISTPLGIRVERLITSDTVPWNVGQTMNTTDLEEGLNIVLRWDRAHALCECYDERLRRYK